MDKQTLSNYGWLTIVTLILAVMLALATPFGTYVGDAVVSVANGFVGASNEAVDEDNIKDKSEKFDSKFDYTAFDKDITYGTNAPELNHNGTIPVGGTYITYNGIEYTAGQAFPTINEGDVYYYEDYMYCYCYYWCTNCDEWTYECGCTLGSDSDWYVRVKNDSQTKYSDHILESINGHTINSLWNAFYSCHNLIDASNINIPSTVWDYDNAFGWCYSLTKAPVIPDYIENGHTLYLGHTFNNCASLSGTIIIDEINISFYDSCFYDTNVTSIKMSNGQTHPMEADLLDTKY